MSETDIHIVKSAADATQARLMIVSYDLCAKDGLSKRLKERQFQVIIADESHYLKSNPNPNPNCRSSSQMSLTTSKI